MARSFPPTTERSWAVVLAGGEGVRCRNYCQTRYADGRPEQFCAVRGGRSLVEETLQRSTYFAPLARTVVSVCRTHLVWRHLWELSPSGPLTSIQPRHAGTGPAALLAALLIEMQCPGATVAFFPANHYVSNKRRLMRPVHEAAAWLANHPDTLITLAAPATYAETDYGWLLPVGTRSAAEAEPTPALLIDKPALAVAERLLELGAYWNTSVVICRGSTLLRTMAQLEPRWWQALLSVRVLNDDALDAVYASLPAFDLGADVLQRCGHVLRLLPLRGLTWCDLADESRLLALEGMTAKHE